ncbi:MAG: aminomethyl-transferring glycine dehydrogenase subunit GcvPA [Bacteroides sp.]|nr:aminomethyl-transferring glycine dehydrogenase subunit GcvPA [Bacteroides sp.]MCM1448489.1 aminomethyl-transferring glycine dehydrogenase subunit GcvPA [Bacteroides sp.]
MKYFPHTADDLSEMLKVVGVNSLDELYAEVPEELKFNKELSLPSAMSEIEVRKAITSLSQKNKQLISFAGAGVYDHYTPSVVPYIASRSEFSTSYTPYQAEISQGTLQYIFEYQSMMADLTGMEISNASMYDGSTATAEAMMMCVAAAKKRNRVLISETFNPAVIRVVETYAKFHGIDLIRIPARDGITDMEALHRYVDADDVAGVLVPQPNYYGIIEDFSGLADFCHSHKSLLTINSVASALGVLKSPGEWGADIACGEAQSLGIPTCYGGPYIGYLCTTSALVRKMPGRLVGATTDADGKRCFVLTMQAREQHIRREKATSNICTAQGFMCLHVAAYLAFMGKRGLRDVNEQSYGAAHELHDRLLALDCFEEAFPDKPFLNEFTLKYTGCPYIDTMQEAVSRAGFIAGVKAEGRNNEIIFAATEQRSPQEIDDFITAISRACHGTQQ